MCILALCIALLAISAPTVAIANPILTMVIAFALLVAAILLYVLYAHMPGFGSFSVFAHPLFWSFVWLAAMFVLPGIYGALRPGFLEERYTTYSFSQTYTAWGVSLVVFGALIIWIGFDTLSRIVKPSAFLRNFGNRLPSARVLILAFGIVATLQLITLLTLGSEYSRDVSALGPFAGLLRLFAVIADTNLLIVAFIAYGAFLKRYSWHMLAAVVGVQIMLDLASGFRKPIVWMMLTIFIAALLAGANMRRLAAFGVILFGVAIIVVPMMPFIRQSITSGDPMLSALGHAYQESWGKGLGEGFAGFGDAVMRRQTEVAQMPGVILEQTPQDHRFRGWLEFLLIPTMLVPRFLWPGKPQVTQGVEFSHEYLGFPLSSTSSTAMTIMGEAYMFAGFGTLIVACLIVGGAAALVFRLFIQSGMIPLGIAMIPRLIDIDSQFSSMLLGFIQDAFIFTVVAVALVTLPASQPLFGKGEPLGAMDEIEDRVQ